MEPSPSVIAALFLAALVAGVVDAIGGGGGLLTVPALLAAGLPPALVFGTNKGSAVFGSGAALFRFWRAGFIDGARARWLFPLGLLGSLGGAALLLTVDPRALRPLVLMLLVGAGVGVAFARPVSSAAAVPRAQLKAAALALALGAYDGFFGPGTGTFLIFGFVALLHQSLQHASANAKVVNFASNLAAVAVFVAHGTVIWRLSIPMAVGQFLGGSLGAHLAVRGGNVLVRRVTLVVVVALVAKLSFDLWSRTG